ncbi:MAG: alpha-D-ribose 1-methylphosphonate 5-triphosphate diphosphatase [Pseudomonadota bacterium]
MAVSIVNANIVTPEAVVPGGLAAEHGMIAEIGAEHGGEDFDGDLLIPGLVDIHTDNLEKHFFPRPGVDWNTLSAAIIHDGMCAAVGVTTVFDSLSVGSWSSNEARHLENMIQLVDGLEQATHAGLLKTQHFIHWRCETSSPVLTDLLDQLIDKELTRLLSVMDHTPGQRQYPDIEKHKARWREHLGLSEAEVEERIESALANQAKFAPLNREAVSKVAKERDLSLASHDDQLKSHVEQAKAIEAHISEFPTTLEAAGTAKDYGMTVVMGAPNLMRGRSYSGNVSASDLAHEGLLDAFASDYVPRSMIEAALALTKEPFGWSVPDAVATVTKAPAQSVGLDDRGALEVGKRADFIRVHVKDGRPLIRGVWVNGERVS